MTRHMLSRVPSPSRGGCALTALQAPNGEIWRTPRDLEQSSTILTRGDEIVRAFALELKPVPFPNRSGAGFNSSLLEFSIASGRADVQAQLKRDEWTHFAVTWERPDAGTARLCLYLNGALAAGQEILIDESALVTAESFLNYPLPCAGNGLFRQIPFQRGARRALILFPSAGTLRDSRHLCGRLQWKAPCWANRKGTPGFSRTRATQSPFTRGITPRSRWFPKART